MKKIALAAAAVATLAGTAAVYAAERPLATWFAPASENAVTHHAGYTFGVHPAFSREAFIVSSAGRRTELYRQTQVTRLPAGRTEPPAQHVIELSGGAAARDLGITVRDPRHQIARITVELYGADHVPGQHSPVVETLVVGNTADTCPPNCE